MELARDRRRDLAGLAAFSAAISAINLAKPFHIDEPQFLAVAAQILRQPLHPFSFIYNWTGVAQPFWRIASNPPLWPYLLAAALGVAGGAQWLTRLVFFPLDAAAACALYLIAARFLKKPLWPVLCVVASPAWALSVGSLMAEKLTLACGLWGLWSFLRGLDDDRPLWLAAAAALLGAACLAKYAGAAFIATALGYGVFRRLPPRRLIFFGCAAVGPLIVYGALAAGRGADAVAPVLSSVRFSSPGTAAQWVHRARSLACFLAGCGVATAIVPLWTRSRRLLVFSALAVAVLFLPWWDGYPMRPLDRFLGAVLGLCGILALSEAFLRPSKGRPFWVCWMIPWTVLTLGFYPIIAARLILFLVLPCTLALAEIVEARAASLRGLWPFCATCAMALTLSLSYVDFVFARAQKDLAAEVGRQFAGRRIWFTGHWGLQYYFEKIGARAIDGGAGWNEVRGGDVVVIPSVNLRAPPPARPLRAVMREARVDCALPLRLIGFFDPITGIRDQAGFYSNSESFLPFTISRQPLESYQIGVIQ